MNDSQGLNAILPLFARLPSFEDVIYKGALQDKIMSFETLLSGSPGLVLVMTVIRQEEVLLWDSCREMLKNSLAAAEPRIRGVFIFDLLSIEMAQGLDIFQWGELTQLIINHSRKTQAGQSRLIKYCSVYGLLTKKSDVDWGKIQLCDHVKVFDKDPEQVPLMIKKFFKICLSYAGQRRLQGVFWDLSREPIFIQDHQQQIEGVKQLMEKFKNESRTGALVDFYIMDKNGTATFIY
ncbi:MAG TPA: hypothetical protein DD723_07325 [Candidatus Omnitrophica bacterium]|nr:MAG: hypothetical protein A2Z81_09235 [Omnitrophica WOR_2 bacterium GWA2_45_18]HBR15336.1 hypothetical protein [Candidatus Omnitrophota bacterium]